MATICPLCNALHQVQSQCPLCGQTMADGGPVDAYLDAYQPCAAVDQDAEHQVLNKCQHIVYCAACRYDEQMMVVMVNV